VEAGVYPSHVGFETLATRDNWNYTRSFMGEFSPYYQAGVRVAFPLGERWSSEVHLLNGWQLITDNNRGKTLGWKFAFAGDRIDASFNGLAGPERPDDDRDRRILLDSVMVWRIDPAWSAAATLDVAGEERPEDAAARWWGAAIYVRRAGDGGRYAGTLRVERFDDSEGAISGTAQRLDSATATLEMRPFPNLILKAEGRYDRSSAPVFAADERDASGAVIRDRRDQAIVLVGAVATF
ncbi:MAG TPA: outer membrane beta-barrel protein, partial [Dongiaceae bacterium]|nr:outer membrane beta-barrel protein [Dongiaceae bacterium]